MKKIVEEIVLAAADGDESFLNTGSPEFNRAFAEMRAGNSAPYCILCYHAGMPEPLIGHVLDGLVPANSEMAHFIATILAGEYERPKHLIKALHRNRVMGLVNIYTRALEDWRRDPERDRRGAEVGEHRFKSPNGIYRCVADLLCMTPGAVAKVVERAEQSSDI